MPDPESALRGLRRALLVEDNDTDAMLTARLLAEVLSPEARVERARSLAEAFERLQGERFELILLDLHLGPERTLEEIPRLRRAGAGAAIVVLTGSDDRELVQQALARGAQDYLRKDELRPEVLQRALRYALQRQRFQQVAAQQVVARKIVRRLLREVGQHVAVTILLRRELGRSLASEVEGETLAAFVDEFNALGAGEVRLVREEGERFEFRARDDIEVTPGAATPTCYIPLGFLEATLRAVTGRQALGTETRCQSLGHEECVFILRARSA